jgi:hypothetical protein
MGSKKVAVVIGRFNPPTIGHYKLIGQAVKELKSNPKFKGLEIAPVVIVIGDNDKHKKLFSDLKSGDEKLKKVALKELMRNPLSPADRISIMQHSGKLGIIPSNHYFSAANPVLALNKLRDSGLEPIAIISGSDRGGDGGKQSDYLRILNQYFLDDAGGPIKHLEIVIQRQGEGPKGDKEKFVNDILSASKSGQKKDIGDTEASGSMARRAVELGYEPEFAKIVGLEDKPALAKKVFNKIAGAIKG